VGAHVTEIGKNAFYTCEKLKSVTLNATVEYLDYSVFANCEALEEIVIPEGVKTIGYLLEDGECGSTFSNCTALKRVVFPASLTNIYANAFYGCTSLEEIAFCGSESAWGNVMIGQGNDQLGTIKVTCNYNAQ
jgi:hypothetical protein